MPLTRGIGKQIQVAIAKESSRGTTPASSGAFWLPTDDWEVEERFVNAVDQQTYGVIEDNTGQTRVKNWAEGALRVPITGTTTGLLFLSMFGTDTPALHSGETTVYDHVMTVAQTVQHQSISVYVHDPIATPTGATADYSHANGVVTKLDIEYALGNFTMMNATIKALRGSTAAVVFVPSQGAETRFLPQNMVFKLASSTSGLNAATAIKLKSAKITIDSNSEDDDVLGSTSPRDFLNKEFSIEGEIEAIWQNESDFKDAAIANTTQAMRLDLINTDVSMGVVPTNPQLRIDLAKVNWVEISRPVKIKDIMYQTAKFKAAYSFTDGYMARLTLVNQKSAY